MTLRFDDIGNRLKAFRIASGLSADEVASRLNHCGICGVHSPRCRTRSRFENRTIGDGGLREIEKSCFTSGQVLALKVRGTF